jgi:hypothetical protein
MTKAMHFLVEQAGCESCAARVQSALAGLLAIKEITVDEGADIAAVRVGCERVHPATIALVAAMVAPPGAEPVNHLLVVETARRTYNAAFAWRTTTTQSAMAAEMSSTPMAFHSLEISCRS